VEQVVVLGDKRKFPLAVIVASLQAYKVVLPGRAITEADRVRLVDERSLHDLVEGDVFRRVEDFARHERPKRILLVGEPFTIDNEQLTPTLKPRRQIIAAAHAARIDAVYAEAEAEAELEAG
jgi:long-chain acyl-CoA synthetase